MERISVTQAARHFSEIINRVMYQRMSFELEQSNKIIARLSPVQVSSPLQVKDLNRFFANLPHLGDDAQSFASDIRSIRKEIGPEKDPWA